MRDVYVVSCCRTAVGAFGGALKDTPAAELGAVTVAEALKRANVKPEAVNEVIFGGVLTAGLGQNIARPGPGQGRYSLLCDGHHPEHGVRLRHEGGH